MSNYARYIYEREGYLIEEDERGFATYLLIGDECYIRDIYVHPDFRKDGIASQYADKIESVAKLNGSKYLTGSVWIGSSGVEDSIKVLLAYGFKVNFLRGEGIFFKKEIVYG